MPHSKRVFFLLQIIIVITVSCSTERIIPFSQAGSSRPEIIRLKNNTEYRIYSYQIGNKVSGDSLVIYDKSARKNLAVISESEIEQIKDKKLIRPDSPAYYLLLVIPLLFINF